MSVEGWPDCPNPDCFMQSLCVSKMVADEGSYHCLWCECSWSEDGR
jgi:aspartate carbamoyltransferase regulatory subunit